MTNFSLPLDPEAHEALYDEMREYFGAPRGDYRYNPMDPIDPIDPPVYDPREDFEEERMPDFDDDFLAPQEDKGNRRLHPQKINHQASVYRKSLNVQEGLGLVVEETVGGAKQVELFEDFRPWD